MPSFTGMPSASPGAPAAVPFLAAATVTLPRLDAALPSCLLQQHTGPLLAAAEHTVRATLLLPLLPLQLVDAGWHGVQLCVSTSVDCGSCSPRAGGRSVAAEWLRPQQAGCPTLDHIA